MPSSTPQWSAGALRQPPTTPLILPGKWTLLPGHRQGARSLIPGPTLAALPHLLALITTIVTIFTILIDHSHVAVPYTFKALSHQYCI